MSDHLGKYISKPFDGNPDQWVEWELRMRSEALGLGEVYDLMMEVEAERQRGGNPGDDDEDEGQGGSARTSKKVVEEHMKKNRQLIALLGRHTKGKALTMLEVYIRNVDGKGAWRALLDKYSNCSEVSVGQKYFELFERRLGEGEDPTVYFDDVTRIQRGLQGAGEIVTDSLIRHLTLHKLPESYAGVRTMMDSGLTAKISFEDFKFTIQNAYQRHQQSDGGGGGGISSTLAMSAKLRNIICHHCNERGHKKWKCPQWKKEQKKGSNIKTASGTLVFGQKANFAL